MFRRIRKTFFWLLLLGTLTIFIFLGLATFTSQTVIAAITQLEEAPGEIVYRSQQKLIDESGNTWQVILFKRVNGSQVTSVNLRLVGFPGSAELLHPQPLTITSSAFQTWKATDIFLDEAPAPTIGQYDIKDILPQLPTDNLRFSIALGRERFVNILVPQSVVQEWQEVLSYSPLPLLRATTTSSSN
jgi:Protein of unknown function (DUF3122)